MTEQVRKPEPAPERHVMSDAQVAEARHVDDAPTQRSEAHEDTLAKTDDLLDEIDEALEGLEAEHVVSANVQKGGQ